MEIIKLKPALVSSIWGGNNLYKSYHKDYLEKTGEAWELSYNREHPTIIDSGTYKGQRLMDVLTNEDIGVNASKMPFLPLLIKLIDPIDDLSIQVHPSDEYALEHENQYGKTEMWYVVDAKPNSSIFYGVKETISKDELDNLMETGEIENKLNRVSVKPGDAFMVNSGTIHAIGKDVIIYEVQQNSTLTYRMYDYNRVDKDGKKRELHLKKAKEVAILDPIKKERQENKSVILKEDNDGYLKKTLLGSCKYFTSILYQLHGNATLEGLKDSFICLTCVKGKGMINNLEISLGDSIFVPANTKEFRLSGDMELISASIPD